MARNHPDGDPIYPDLTSSADCLPSRLQGYPQSVASNDPTKLAEGLGFQTLWAISQVQAHQKRLGVVDLWSMLEISREMLITGALVGLQHDLDSDMVRKGFLDADHKRKFISDALAKTVVERVTLKCDSYQYKFIDLAAMFLQHMLDQQNPGLPKQNYLDFLKLSAPARLELGSIVAIVYDIGTYGIHIGRHCQDYFLPAFQRMQPNSGSFVASTAAIFGRKLTEPPLLPNATQAALNIRDMLYNTYGYDNNAR